MYSLVLHLILTLLQIFLYILFLHLPFSPQKKETTFFWLPENSFVDTGFWDSDVFNSDAGALARSRSYLDLDRYLRGSFNDADACYEMQRDGENITVEKVKTFLAAMRSRRGCISFILSDTSCVRTWMATRYCGQLLP